MFKIFRYFLYLIVALGVLVGGVVIFFSLQDGKQKYNVSLGDIEVPQFTETALDFRHAYENSRGLPYSAGAIIDYDNDGKEDLFLGGGLRQADALFSLVDDHFVNVVEQVGLVKQGEDLTLGAAVIDSDANGYDDLVVSREKGIWLYLNDGGKFSLKRLDIEFSNESAPLAVAVTDLNRDGKFDFFVPVVSRTGWYEWLKGGVGREDINSRLYLNNGDDTFTDVTVAAGLGEVGEVRQAAFLDLDDDGSEDLVLLHPDGTLSTWKNLGELLFAGKPHFHSSRRGYYLGLGTGDYDNDGRVDLLLTNRGSTQPQLLADVFFNPEERLTSQWVVMNNSGFFAFRDDAPRLKLENYELARGAGFADLNNDGRTDLVVSQNHPFWPPHLVKKLRLPGRLFVQNSSGEFAETGSLSGVQNKFYGVAPLVADFNNDGYVDIVQVNLDAASRVFLSTPGKNNFLKIKLPNKPHSLGALVKIITLAGTEIDMPYLVGKTLCGDSSHVLHVGLGSDKAIEVLVKYQDGSEDQTSGVLYNTTVVFD